MNDVTGMPQNVVVLGGGSDISRALLSSLARRRLSSVLLAGRTVESLEGAVKDLHALRVEKVEVALLDVTKALAMLRRMNVPVTGIIENMGGFVCGHCGEITEIFGRGGGERFAREHGIDYLGSVPLDVTVRQGADVGIPAVAQREPGPAARILVDIASQVAARMSVAAARNEAPVLTIS